VAKTPAKTPRKGARKAPAKVPAKAPAKAAAPRKRAAPPPPPASPLTPYQKRIARGLAAGKTRQEARGKKPGEARERRQREAALGGLTTYQRQQVRAFMAAQSARGRQDEDKAADSLDRMLAWTRRNGYEAFAKVRKTQKDALREREAARARGEGWVTRRGMLQVWLDEYGDDPPEPIVFIYN
jgi:hypothetical protein